jgi:catecholate siderophore receptor
MVFIFTITSNMSKQSVFRTLLTCLVAGTFILSAQAQQAPPMCTVRGTVVDQDHSSVAGAVVAFARPGEDSSQVISTDGHGAFSISLPPGNYDVRVKATGFASLSRTIVVCPGQNDNIELSLEIEPTSAVVNIVDSGVYQIGSTSSATKTLTELRNIPQSISVATKQQLADQNMTSIGEVVRYQPGITSHQGENNRDQVIIRGQSSSADFFINGIRDDVQYFRDVYNLDRIEILRGPNALVFGRGGGGGVLNRVTKEADFSPAYEFALQGGSYENRRATFDLNQPVNKKIAVRVNGVAEYSESFRRNVNLRRFGFSPTVSLNPDVNTHITAGIEVFRDRRVADRGITSFQGLPADVPISTYYGNPDDSRVRANANIFTGSVDRAFGKLLIRNRTMFGDYDRFYQNYVPGTVNAAQTLVALTAYNNATHRRSLFNQTDLIYSVKTGDVRHTLLGGIELGNQRSRNFRNTGYFNNSSTSIQVPYDDPSTTVPVIFRQSASDADNRVRVNLGAAYVQDQIEVNKYLQLVAGARFDYFDLRFHNNRNAIALRRIDRLVSPRFGVVVKPTTNVSLYGSYSVSYLPSSGDQFSSLTAITQQVKPEKFTNYEVGLKWDLRTALSVTSALYRLDRTNTRSIDPNDPTRIIQAGSQRTNGFEFSASGSLTGRWSLTAGYAFQDAFISRATATAAAGKDVAQVPHHSFSIWNKYQLTTKFAAGLGIVRRTDMFAGIDNTVVLPGYTRADAAVYYSFNESWRLQANVENVLNSRYFANADGNTNISPGAPRSVKLSLIARIR